MRKNYGAGGEDKQRDRSPARIVAGERHDDARAARIGAKGCERPLDDGASRERGILLGQPRTEAPPAPAAGMTSQ